MLPDEIISEILSPALKVSDELFSDTSDVSPFANPTLSTSAYLLVCKDWLRVATPLLYNIVVLRSKAQAAALQKVLHKHSEFGRFIKKLRVEGGYGMAMHTILASAPNITDLFLTFAIWSSDSTDGLCKGLPLINPHRVLLVDPVVNLRKIPTNKCRTALTRVLFHSISKWDNLEIFSFPYTNLVLYYDSGWEEQASKLMEALIKSTTIQTILLPPQFELRAFFYPLLDIPGLRILHVQTQHVERDQQELMKNIKSRGKLNVTVRYNMPDSSNDVVVFRAPDIAPSLNPSFIPMASASAEVREAVWKRVFLFALSGDTSKPLDHPDPTAEGQSSRLAILLVSKYFTRLALAALYNDLRVTSRNASSIVQQLHYYPYLCPAISSIDLCSLRFQDPALRSIVGRANRVERFHSQDLFAEEFELLAETTGSTLRKLATGFRFSLNSPAVSTSIFARFTNLEICELRGHATFYSPSGSAPKTVLAQLHTLQLANCDPVILNAFSAMSLPVLHTIRIPSHQVDCTPTLIHFLHAHGGPLIHIEFNYSLYIPWNDFNLFDVCTSLLGAEFSRGFNLERLTCKDPHRSLAKISCNDVDGCAGDVDPTLFPALREIQCCNCVWPKSERETSKNRWVPLAEALLEKNIKLTDSDGRHWIPRVKNMRGKR
ncbi:hypothetical protein C8R43DRAFT_322752 [Mycena crocata]|nr:hypothetical protein C8R43DRAFT_322752 [Mycena crocata]